MPFAKPLLEPFRSHRIFARAGETASRNPQVERLFFNLLAERNGHRRDNNNWG